MESNARDRRVDTGNSFELADSRPIEGSLLVKAVFALLALPGLVTLALAVGVGDMGLSLAVILNAMRLRFVR